MLTTCLPLAASGSVGRYHFVLPSWNFNKYLNNVSIPNFTRTFLFFKKIFSLVCDLRYKITKAFEPFLEELEIQYYPQWCRGMKFT